MSKAYACGAALEIYHAASLIFDDIQDGSEIRRQGKTVHVSDGLSLAMSLGAILRSLMYHPINQCQELTTDEKCFVHECIDKTCTKVACGQALEMMWRKYPEMDIERDAYIDMISKKTGSLIAAAFTIGAYLSNTNPETAAQLGKFGEEFGVLFQLHNDLLDLSGGEMIGRPAYDDLRCAKRTYIVLSCLARLEEMKAEEDLEKFLGLLHQRRLDEEQIDWCVEQLNRTEQIEAARVDLVNRLEALRSSVDRIDVPLPLRETLSKLLMFFIKVPSSPAKS